MRKIALVLILLFLSGMALAELQDDTVAYGSTWDIDTTLSGQTNEEASLQFCGSTVELSTDPQSPRYTASIHIPGDVSCSIGTHTVEVQKTNEQSQIQLEVTSKNMDAHSGKYLYLEGDPHSSAEYLRNFFLTNDGDTWNSNGQHDLDVGDQSALIVQENDWGSFDSEDEYGRYIPEKGEVIKKDANSIAGSVEFLDRETVENNVFSSGGDTADDVLARTFGTLQWDIGESANYGCSIWETNAESCSPVHDDFNHKPEGDIIYAHEPGEDGRADDYRFHVCRDGNDRKLVEDRGEYYRCDTTGSITEEWRYSNDNDDSGGISGRGDFNDWDPVSGICEPIIVEENGEKVAYYDAGEGSHNPDGYSGCDYRRETASEGLEMGEPKTGLCFKNGEVRNTGDDDIERFCESLGGVEETTAFHDLDADGRINALTAKYYVTEEAIPTTEEDPNAAAKFVRNSYRDQMPSDIRRRCVDPENDAGFVNTRCETLHMAEVDYVGNSLSVGFGSLVDNPRLHEASTWEERNMTFLATQKYGSNNPPEYRDAWNIENAGVSNSNVYSQSRGVFGDQDVFSGGFAGKCPTGTRWQYAENVRGYPDQWMCTGALDWDFNYTVPNVQGGSGTTTGGVFLQKDIFNRSDPAREVKGSFSDAWLDQKGGDAHINRIRYDCYPGSPRPGTGSIDWKYFPEDGDITYIGSNPFSETIFLPDTIDTSEEADYSCEFEFEIEREDGSTDWESDLGDPTEIKDMSKAVESLNLGSYVGFSALNNGASVASNLPGPSTPASVGE